ncbi:hypothetical protein [Actinomadura livida]|uniref:Uncharacterized protein n=1 Tax=Actinomadura livida TaxID=79909 RepID=A0A7W7IEP9_9ACTN|nr:MULTISPECIES: hypothetical protein [Actinomadura]MBB4775630.1 hypothetical protein [Actinomadura catellatispora]GGT91764.1 hypothetical protein GCM10010208_13500 [Actinomadura livida]
MSDEVAEVPVAPAAALAPEADPVADEPAGEEPDFPAVAPPDPTGDPRVDAAVARLGELGARPVSGHVEIYEDVHQRLQDLLASADSADPAEGHEPSGRPAEPERPRPAFPDALRPRP